MRVLRFIVVAVLSVFGAESPLAQMPAQQRPQTGEVPTIGVAHMRPDGTIELYLRATGDGGVIGHGLLEYPPTHPQYHDVLRHLGGMKPGETKDVPPWPR